MPIRVRCPNPACNCLLNVPERLAGKGCQCPKCKGELHVPLGTPAVEEVVETVEVVETTGYSERPQPIHTALPGPGPDLPPLPSESQPDGEEPGDQPAPSRAVVRSPRNVLNLILLVVGTALLAATAFMALFPWISISIEAEAKGKKFNDKAHRLEDYHKQAAGSFTIDGLGHVAGSAVHVKQVESYTLNEELPPGTAPEGMLFLIIGFTAALMGLLGLTLVATDMPGGIGSWRIATIVTLIAEAASIMLLCWALAWIWRVVTLSQALHKWAEANVHQGSMDAMATATTFPGLGLFLALGLAAGAAYVFSLLGGRLTGRGWVYVADLVGLLLGGLILLVSVRAWDVADLLPEVERLLQ